MALAPLVIFAYNRPSHLRHVVESVIANELAKKTEVIFFCDGARKPENIDAVNEVKSYVGSLKNSEFFKSITINFSEMNKGLAHSIIKGVSETIAKYGKVIVLEDDLVVGKYFLNYMNEALDLYEGEPDAVSIHGYIYPVKKTLPETFFIRGADCWGWATWKRGWDLFENDGVKLLRELQEKKMTKKFDFDGCYPYTRMLEDQIAGKNNSWAIRWYASAFLANKFTLYPGKSLVQNIGNDGSGTHCAEIDLFDTELFNKKIELKKNVIIEDDEARAAIKLFFKPKVSFLKKIKHKIKKKISKIKNKHK